MNNQNPNIPQREITQQIVSNGERISEIRERSHGGHDLNMEDAENGDRDPINGADHLPTYESIIRTANQDWISKWLSNDSLKSKASAVLTIAWSIWKERCLKNFQGKNLNHYVTTRLALKLVNDTDTYLSNFVSENNPRTVTVGQNLNSVISQLSEKCHVIFSDGAYDKKSKLSGIGLVMNDITSSFLGCKLKARNMRNAEEAESLVLLEALKWAEEKDLEKVCFVSDAKTVIDSFNFNNNQLFCYNNSVLDECRTFIPSFSFVKFQFLRRNHIVLADLATKFSRRSRTSGEWMGFIPEFLNSTM
ncbi:uncharacterized protein LOC113342583 [Papaver somniferum]|uniref:uncharacterized protein LOC113342583 n=1 Tax=Papaver somniferum TaxID=3469 RepID=UPI000E6FDBB6|nr:uncharacterized protein LOC113342583 [Papaver somniferum]